MGTSEIDSAVLALPQVIDALVVDLRAPAQRVGCRRSWCWTEALRSTTSSSRRSSVASVPTVRRGIIPDEVLQISVVPRTLSGKALEVPIKRILMGIPPEQAVSRDALANPEALEYFVELAARW